MYCVYIALCTLLLVPQPGIRCSLQCEQLVELSSVGVSGVQVKQAQDADQLASRTCINAVPCCQAGCLFYKKACCKFSVQMCSYTIDSDNIHDNIQDTSMRILWTRSAQISMTGAGAHNCPCPVDKVLDDRAQHNSLHRTNHPGMATVFLWTAVCLEEVMYRLSASKCIHFA